MPATAARTTWTSSSPDASFDASALMPGRDRVVERLAGERGRDEHDRSAPTGSLPQLVDQLDATDVGEPQVDDHDVGRRSRRSELQRLRPRVRRTSTDLDVRGRRITVARPSATIRWSSTTITVTSAHHAACVRAIRAAPDRPIDAYCVNPK